MNHIASPKSKKILGWGSLWAIGVGLVISGDSFGWNNGWAISGPYGFLIPFSLISLMYFSIIHCNIQLGLYFPNANNPSIYSEKAFGKMASKIVLFFMFIEYVFTLPILAIAIGEYLAFIFHNRISSTWIAYSFILFFCFINLFNIKLSVIFIWTLSILAIFELCIYFFFIGPNFSVTHLQSAIPFNHYDLYSILQSFPYAIWIFLGIEGISLLTKEIKPVQFKKNFIKGYYTSFITVFILTITVFTLTAGSNLWDIEKWGALVNENEHPLPHNLATTLGTKNLVVQIFTSIGLFGLVASLQSLNLASIQLTQSILISDWKISRNTLKLSSLIIFIISIISIKYFNAKYLIEFSVFGALGFYLMNACSYLEISSLKNKFKFTQLDANQNISRRKNLVIHLFIICMVIINLIRFIYWETKYFIGFLLLFLIYLIGIKFYNKKIFNNKVSKH